MKKFFISIKSGIRSAALSAKQKITQACNRLIQSIIDRKNNYAAKYHALDKRRQNRVLVLVLSSVFIGDYLMICFLAGKNPVDIFPSIPVLDMRDEITVYIPSRDSDEPMKETRLVQKNDSPEEFIKQLTRFVVAGSHFENTRTMTPVEGNVRKVWILDKTCVVDMRLEALDPEAPLIKGSEMKFRTALEKTVKENVKNIDNVIVLENGIPEKYIWENATADQPVIAPVQDQEGQLPSNTSTAGPDINR